MPPETAGGVEELLVTGLPGPALHHIAHDGGRRIEGSAVLTLRQGKAAEEVFIDLAKDVHGAVFGDILENADDVESSSGSSSGTSWA